MSGLGGLVPHAHVWPWPGRHRHAFGHVLPRMAMAMAIRGRELLCWRDQLPIPTRYEISVCWGTSPPPNVTFLAWPGGTSPPTRPRLAMAGPPSMAMATFYRGPQI